MIFYVYKDHNLIIKTKETSFHIKFEDISETIFNIYGEPIINDSKNFYIYISSNSHQFQYLLNYPQGEKLQIKLYTSMGEFFDKILNVYLLSINFSFKEGYKEWSCKFFLKSDQCQN